MKYLLLTTIAAVVLVGCVPLQSNAKLLYASCCRRNRSSKEAFSR
ncbi:hypothetical protein OAG73_02130 [bacterium]|nr:hypothetical protein [bacterium]